MSDSGTHELTIEFGHVYFEAEGRELISNLSLQIRRGETFVLLGRSGSGKTTLLKLINGLLKPNQGEVLVEGRSTLVWDPIRLRRRIGYVIQGAGLFPHFTVERNVGLISRLEGWPPERVKAKVEQMLALVGLDPAEFRDRYPHQLSGGQQQRVGVARALAGDPPTVLMDEPFGALDPLTRTETQREFLALKRRVHKTIVFVTHDMREALLMADRIGLIEAGKLAGVYTPAEFLHSAEPLAKRYVDALQSGEEALHI
jgi:osmoprotectant transport system ATP-binding protein